VRERPLSRIEGVVDLQLKPQLPYEQVQNSASDRPKAASGAWGLNVPTAL